MNLLGLKGTLNELARANGVQWYGHVLTRDSDEVLRRTLDFEVVEKRGRERPNMMWKRQVKKHIDKIELKKKDTKPLSKQSGVMVFMNFLET